MKNIEENMFNFICACWWSSTIRYFDICRHSDDKVWVLYMWQLLSGLSTDGCWDVTDASRLNVYMFIIDSDFNSLAPGTYGSNLKSLIT